MDGPNVRGLQLDRNLARETLGEDSHEYDHAVASVDEPLRLEPPSPPHVLHRCKEMACPISSPEDLLPPG